MLKCVDLTKVRIFYIHRLAAGDTSSISELKMLLRCFVQRNTERKSLGFQVFFPSSAGKTFYHSGSSKKRMQKGELFFRILSHLHFKKRTPCTPQQTQIISYKS